MEENEEEDFSVSSSPSLTRAMEDEVMLFPLPESSSFSSFVSSTFLDILPCCSNRYLFKIEVFVWQCDNRMSILGKVPVASRKLLLIAPVIVVAVVVMFCSFSHSSSLATQAEFSRSKTRTSTRTIASDEVVFVVVDDDDGEEEDDDDATIVVDDVERIFEKETTSSLRSLNRAIESLSEGNSDKDGNRGGGREGGRGGGRGGEGERRESSSTIFFLGGRPSRCRPRPSIFLTARFLGLETVEISALRAIALPL